jgi:hypothetical protein
MTASIRHTETGTAVGFVTTTAPWRNHISDVCSDAGEWSTENPLTEATGRRSGHDRPVVGDDVGGAVVEVVGPPVDGVGSVTLCDEGRDVTGGWFVLLGTEVVVDAAGAAGVGWRTVVGVELTVVGVGKSSSDEGEIATVSVSACSAVGALAATPAMPTATKATAPTTMASRR